MKRLEEFMFKYFSWSAFVSDKYGWVNYTLFGIFITPLIIGVILDQLGKDYIPALIVFGCLFLPFCLVWITVWFYHNWRIKHENKDNG